MFGVIEFARIRRGNFGTPLFYFEQVGSTNLIAEKLARDGAPEGSVVLANEQTLGKGRKGNAWFSPADKNLYFSLILRPETAWLKYIPYMACISVIRAISRLGVHGDLKWPNDVMVNDRKLCGFLIQTAIEEQRLQFAVVGGGINVNTTKFPHELQDVATSLALETGSAEDRELLLATVLLELEKLYEKIQSADWEDFALQVEGASTYIRDCPVKVIQEGRTIEGTTRGLDPFGGLKLLTAEGEETVYAGEVLSCRRK